MIPGYQCFSGACNASSRGIAIYARQDLPIDYCNQMENVAFKESVWCDLRMGQEKLLIGAVYKSPSSDRDNHDKLNECISQATSLGRGNVVIVGDFNFPEIDWSSWTVNGGEEHVAFKFVECIRDNIYSNIF